MLKKKYKIRIEDIDACGNKHKYKVMFERYSILSIESCRRCKYCYIKHSIGGCCYADCATYFGYDFVYIPSDATKT